MMNETDPPRASGEEPIDAEADGPATEEERHDESRADNHCGIFSQEEEGEFHRGIFRVVAADEFGFTFGKSKGVRLVSAKMEVVKMKKVITSGIREASGEESFRPQ